MLRGAAVGLSALLTVATVAACNSSAAVPGSDGLGIVAVDVAFTVIPISPPLGIAGAADVDEFSGEIVAASEIDPEVEVDVDPEEPDEVETETDEDGDGNVINGEYEGGSTETGTSYVREGTTGPQGGDHEPRDKDR